MMMNLNDVFYAGFTAVYTTPYCLSLSLFPSFTLSARLLEAPEPDIPALELQEDICEEGW